MIHRVLFVRLLLLLALLGQRHVEALDNNNDLLKDALDMIYRRQNELNPSDEAIFLKQPHSYFSEERNQNYPNDLEYLRSLDSDDELTLPYEVFYNSRPNYPDKYLDYANEDDEESPKAINLKRKALSVFRERLADHQSRPNKNKQISEYLLSKNPELDESDVDLENELEYANLLQEYWERYKAEKKLAEQIHAQRLAERYGNAFQDGEPNLMTRKRFLYKRGREPGLRLPFLRSDNVVMKKRFPVTKRSSNYASKSFTEQSKTDPKVERDLSNIFGSKDLKSNNSDALKKSKTPKKVSGNVSDKKNITAKTKKGEKKPEYMATNQDKDRIEIKKKSIDLSNYFGIDKRNKKITLETNPTEMDDNWLVERYKSTLKKVTTNDDNLNDASLSETREQKQRRDETKLDVIKNKLKNIEDMIIDEALKYTGAHEGETDSKEIQDIKDKVMSRLAAVYSLEKMRRALGEFKKSIAEQRQKLKTQQLNGEFDILETDDDIGNGKNGDNHETTTSTTSDDVNGVPAKKDSAAKSDNSISQIPGESGPNDECEVLEAIERQCNHLAIKAGEQLVQPLCMLHQVCTLCGMDDGTSIGGDASQQNRIENPNSDLACYYMFVAESEHACFGETQCRRRANYALNALRDNQSSQMYQLANENMCPRSNVCVENVLDIAKRRLSFSPYIMNRRNI